MLGSVDNVRAIAGWPSEDEVPDSEIEQQLDAATRRIVTLTGVEEAAWDIPPTDVNKSLAADAAEVCAASRVVLRVSGTEKVVERSRELGALCQQSLQLVGQALASTESDNPSFIDVTSPYTTYPLNESVDPYDPNL
jgi:hypothetical protein